MKSWKYRGPLIFLIASLAFLFPMDALFAEDTEPPDKNSDNPDENDASKNFYEAEGLFNANEVVVTAKRFGEDLFSTDRSLSVIDEQRLNEVVPRTVPEALMEAPGVFSQQTNTGGGSPIIRGLVGPQVLILVDGVRLNNSVFRTGPVQYLNLVDPFSIRRIEVLRGPGSVLYGSDAMGGVIQVFPIGPRPEIDGGFRGGGNLSTRYSSADYGRAGHAHADAGYGPAGILGGGTYKETDNLIGGRDVGEQVFTGYENWSGIGRADLEFDNWGIRLGYLFNEIEDAGRTDALYSSNSLQLYDNRDHLAYAKLNAKVAPLATESILTLSYQDFFERKDSKKVLDDYETEESATRDETTVATIGADWQFSTNVLNRRLRFQYGGMWYRDRIGASGFSREGPSEEWDDRADQVYPDDSSYDNYGAFLMAEGDPVSTRSGHILRLSGGYRLHGMNGAAPEQNDLPSVDFEYQGGVWQSGIQYLYRQYANAAFTYAQGFRAPNLQETVMFGDTGKFFHVPNEELKPETGDTLELDLRGRFWRIQLGTAAYLTYLHDLITREDTTYKNQSEIAEKPVKQTVNGGEAKLWGLEPEMNVDIGAGFSFSGFMTYTWGEEDRLDKTTEPLSRVPPLFGQAALRYETGNRYPWRAFAEVYGRGAGKQERLSPEDTEDPRVPKGGTPEWWTWNLRTGLVTLDYLRLGLAVENLTNVKYKYHVSGVYSPGTNAVMTAELSF